MAGTYNKSLIENSHSPFSSLSPDHVTAQSSTSVFPRSPRIKACDGSTSIEMTPQDTLPPLWMDLVEETREDLLRAKELLSSLQRVQQQRLLHVFGDQYSVLQPEREVDVLSSDITQLLKRCEQRIFRIEPSQGNNTTESRLRRNAQKSLAIQVQDLSEAMRIQQGHYVEALRKRQTVENPATKSAPPFDSHGSVEPDTAMNEDFFVPNRQSTTVARRVDNLDNLVTAQDSEEISNIAQSVADLQSIFHQLSTLVIDQGTILDRIDYNVEQAAQYTTQGTQQLLKAERARRSRRARRVILFLLGFNAILVLLLLLKYTATY